MVYRKVSVLVPTRKRIARLEKMMASFEMTVDGPKAELVFRIDDDDLETAAFLEHRDCTTIVGPRLRGYDSMPTFFNEMAAVASGDVLMAGNDDFVFKTDGWAKLLLEEASLFSDGVFNLGVDTLNADHYPFCIVSKAVANRLGFYWDPAIFWGDIYLRDVMSSLGRCRMLPHVQIDHEWAGFKPDQTFAESRKDVEPGYWSTTHVRAVNAAVERLRGMVAS